MARQRTFPPLNVFINSRLVGNLEREANGAIEFRYAPSWLDWENRFPISLSLPLREERYVGQPVFNVFDNLLPDISTIRHRIAERVGAQGSDVYSLLSALGRDCVGAMEFLPDGTDPGPAGSSDGEPISEGEIADLISSLALAPLGLNKDPDFRISIAGAQEKTALLHKHGRWYKPTGTSATTHILKPRIGLLPNGIDLADSVENEYLCLKILESLGVPVAEATIMDFGPHRTLVIKRFDRLWASDGRLLRLPQEDFCQALSIPSARKYQSDGGPSITQMIGLLQGGNQPALDSALLLRACFIFWLIGATDGHGKNFSLSLKPRGGHQLTPLYDILSAQPSYDVGLIPKKEFKLALSVGKNRHYRMDEIAPRHFEQTAQQAGVPPREIKDTMEELADTAEARMITLFDTLPNDFPEKIGASIIKSTRERIEQAFPDRYRKQYFLSKSHRDIGDLAKRNRNPAKALNAYQQSLSVLQWGRQPTSNDDEILRHLSLVHSEIADISVNQDKVAEALSNYHKALTLAERLAEADPRDTDALCQLPAISEKIGDALSRQGDQATALNTYRQGLKIANFLAAPDRK